MSGALMAAQAKAKYQQKRKEVIDFSKIRDPTQKFQLPSLNMPSGLTSRNSSFSSSNGSEDSVKTPNSDTSVSTFDMPREREYAPGLLEDQYKWFPLKSRSDKKDAFVDYQNRGTIEVGGVGKKKRKSTKKIKHNNKSIRINKTTKRRKTNKTKTNKTKINKTKTNKTKTNKK